MAIRIGINGFGRIGRQVYKAIRERYDQRGDAREAVAYGIISTARLITGAADDDPSGIATYSIAGAQLGTRFIELRRVERECRPGRSSPCRRRS